MKNNNYMKFLDADHLLRQAVERFGVEAKQTQRIRAVMKYWFKEWLSDGGGVNAPDAETLESRIKEEEGIVRRRKKGDANAGKSVIDQWIEDNPGAYMDAFRER